MLKPSTMNKIAIAHVRECDKSQQTLEQHLCDVATLSKTSATKLGFPLAGELVGLLHDLGKYSTEFQNYIQSATGLLDPDRDDSYVDAAAKKGKIDHSSAGAQLIWRHFNHSKNSPEKIVAQILSLCIASHHSGLIDCLTTNDNVGTFDNFSRRMDKSEEFTHLLEATNTWDSSVQKRALALLNDPALTNELINFAQAIGKSSKQEEIVHFHLGLLARLVFSCLIDGDRQNTAEFERPQSAAIRKATSTVSWTVLTETLENHLSGFASKAPIDDVRREISVHCKNAALLPKRLFSLTVPTGGGKTLASLRFALHHAQIRNLDRIIYIVPFTSIIDQNASVTRAILETGREPGSIVLEHHSNLEPECYTWRNKVLSESWDAPVIFTTMVQFLETLFGGGTRGARRMHQLSNSVLIFDEIQALPIKCVHLFNNAINFLTTHCNATAVLCTATQPLLHEVDASRGALPKPYEIITDVPKLFFDLKRVEVHDKRRDLGWTFEDVANLALAEQKELGSCLVVVNTKKSARAIFQKLCTLTNEPTYHLSTDMCATHRRAVLSAIRQKLNDKQPVFCVSTQLIEAGVDVDFGAVIRLAAGLDSIAQAAGRCNRHGARSIGRVYVINVSEESFDSLPDIQKGRQCAERVLDDYRDNPEIFANGLLSPEAMATYYDHYFFSRKDEMSYRVKIKERGQTNTLFELLSTNDQSATASTVDPGKLPYLKQSFMAANKAFAVIDVPTRGVIVPYGDEGQKVVAELASAHDVHLQVKLLRHAQQFTVNLFANKLHDLEKSGAAREIQPESRIFYLDKRHYHPQFGVSLEPLTPMEFLNV